MNRSPDVLLALALSALALLGFLLVSIAPAAQEPGPKPIREAEVAGPQELVAFSARASHPVALAGEEQEEVVHLTLRAAEVAAVPRPGMNLALVIDRSGSMASEDKLRFACNAAEQVVARLRPDDRLSIVSYDDVIRTEVPSTPAAEDAAFLAAIRALVPGNSTDLHGGLVRGYEEVREHFDAARVNGVFLLSDGLANVGVTDPRMITLRAEACREEGVRISTLGMGLDYDEELLLGIAQQAGGNYHYVDQPESVGRYLDQELEQMARVVARDVEVRMELGPGVELRELFGHAHRLEGDTVVVRMRDLFSGQERKLVLRFALRGRSGEQALLAAPSLHYVDAATREERCSAPPALEVRFSDDLAAVRSARNLDVLVQSEIVQNAVALDTAMKLQKEGGFQEAQELLAARYLNGKTANEAEFRDPEIERVLERIRHVLQELERRRSDPRASRRLQLETELMALGYAGG